jgi:hypothetical protein
MSQKHHNGVIPRRRRGSVEQFDTQGQRLDRRVLEQNALPSQSHSSSICIAVDTEGAARELRAENNVEAVKTRIRRRPYFRGASGNSASEQHFLFANNSYYANR